MLYNGIICLLKSYIEKIVLYYMYVFVLMLVFLFINSCMMILNLFL